MPLTAIAAHLHEFLLYGLGVLIGFMLVIIFYRLAKAVYVEFFPLASRFIAILEQHVGYYRVLSEGQKRRFERKLKYFMYSKEFIPRKKFEITDEVKVLISSAAVQLTFGLEDLRFAHFKEIFVFPKPYTSKRTGRRHAGEVSTAGRMAFSWKDVLEGYANPHDGRNLPLHEMAHALRLEDIVANDEFLFLKQEYLREFDRNSKKVAMEMRKGKSSFLRKYAAANRQEFFAVAVESFFERPKAFRAELPELYRILTQLLNQDPAELPPY